MGRQIGDSSTMVNSSIALLQERFKELQRVKEKRQEKELLKLFSESSERHTTPPTPSGCSSPSSSSMHFEHYSHASNLQTPHDQAPTFFNRRPTSSPSPSPPRVPAQASASSLLSLGPYSSSSTESKQRYYSSSYDHQSFRGAPTRNHQTNYWSNAGTSSSSSSPRTVFEHSSDVDTSLHL